MTYATAMILQALERGSRYGFDIIDTTRLRSGTVYPILRRLEELGLVGSHWERVDVARSAKRPARKYYRLAQSAEPFLETARHRYPMPSPSAVKGGARA